MSMLDVRRTDPGRRVGVPDCESSSGSGSGRARAAGVSVTGSPYRTPRERLPDSRGTVPPMDDLFGPYQRTRARVCTLLLDATPDALARTVPACPAWTVKDLAAHLAGVPATLAAGNFPSGDVDEWLQGIVDERREVEVEDLVAEWNALDAAIEPMLQGMGSLMFTDVAIHEHDLRGALGEPDHDALEVAAAMACALSSFEQPLHDAGLGAIAVAHDGRTWRTHDTEAGWTLLVEPWEATRALGSRRTADELRALPSEGGGEAYIAVVAAHLPLPVASLGE
jgi:uncharacterized protein (TIGR03083 family)